MVSISKQFFYLLFLCLTVSIFRDTSVPQSEQQEGDITYEYKVYENVLLRNITAQQPVEENKEQSL